MIVSKNTTNYEYIHGDFDKDNVPNIDDKYPFDSTRTERVNPEVSLSKTFYYIEEKRKKALRYAKRLKKKTGATSARVKDAYSVINKVVRKNDYVTTDFIGLRFTVHGKRKKARALWNKFNKEYHVGKLDKNKEFGKDNKYLTNRGTKSPYRAYHSNIKYKPTKKQVYGLEAQFRTEQYGILNDEAHKDYKEHKPLTQFRKRGRVLRKYGY